MKENVADIWLVFGHISVKCGCEYFPLFLTPRIVTRVDGIPAALRKVYNTGRPIKIFPTTQLILFMLSGANDAPTLGSVRSAPGR